MEFLLTQTVTCSGNLLLCNKMASLKLCYEVIYFNDFAGPEQVQNDKYENSIWLALSFYQFRNFSRGSCYLTPQLLIISFVQSASFYKSLKFKKQVIGTKFLFHDIVLLHKHLHWSMNMRKIFPQCLIIGLYSQFLETGTFFALLHLLVKVNT